MSHLTDLNVWTEVYIQIRLKINSIFFIQNANDY